MMITAIFKVPLVQTVDKGLRVRVNSKGESGNNYNIEIGQGASLKYRG